MKTATAAGSHPVAHAQTDVLVVASLLWRNGRLLVQQRPPDKALALLWEFPGGKIEPGETCEAALIRECAEELGVTVRVGALAWQSEHAGAAQRVRLQFYHASLSDDAAVIHATSAVQWAWLQPSDLPKLPFCPADTDLVQALADGSLTARAP